MIKVPTPEDVEMAMEQSDDDWDIRSDFEALRAKRNAEMQKLIADFAKEKDIPVDEVWSSFDPGTCYCACGAGGPCEHSWDGPDYESEDGCMVSVTCSRCGSVAAYHDMRVGP